MPTETWELLSYVVTVIGLPLTSEDPEFCGYIRGLAATARAAV